ncbi:MAG TPA: type I methionyl aminopeptidase [Chloroflexota bacterium]|nr:type I methionyl aminopeptidase [Chloroflexota bacterium]
MVAKNRREVAGMRRASEATAALLRELARRAVPGVTTRSLDQFARSYIRRLGGEPIFHTQNGFPGAINTSVNDEAVHGVPGDRVLVSGDLLKIDCGIGLGSYCGDSTMTLLVGDHDDAAVERREVMAVASEALDRGIAAVRVGGRIGDIGAAIEEYVGGTTMRVLPQFTGHGIGRRLWEEPSVPNVRYAGQSPRIVEGMLLTIEPVVTAGVPWVKMGADGWTALTRDGAPVAQFEHTIVATRNGPRILSG